MEPVAVLKLMNCEVITWAKVGHLTDGAAQAPYEALGHFWTWDRLSVFREGNVGKLIMMPKTVLGKESISEHGMEFFPEAAQHKYLTWVGGEACSSRGLFFSPLFLANAKAGQMLWAKTTNIRGYSIRRVIASAITGGSVALSQG